jgi:hypothetical protein
MSLFGSDLQYPETDKTKILGNGKKFKRHQ